MLGEALKGSAITSLRCAVTPRVFAFMSAPVDIRFALGSVDGHALQIDELKGTKPTEKIDLFNKRLGVASAIIIASCIKENGVLKDLKCAARVFAFLSMPVDTYSTPASVPVLAVCDTTTSVPTQEPLSRRASRATRRYDRLSGTPGARTGSRVFAFVSAPIDTPTLSLFLSYPSLVVCGPIASEPRAPLRWLPSSTRRRSPI